MRGSDLCHHPQQRDYSLMLFCSFGIFYVTLHLETIVNESMDNEIIIIILGTTLGLVLLFNLVVYLFERKGIDWLPDEDAKGLKNRIKRIIVKIILLVIFIMSVASFCIYCTDRCSNSGHSSDDEYYYDGHRPDKF